MADENATKKTYTNKNIRKLRAVSMVCGLTSSWQKWVTDNETKQANEPSGWAPSWLDDPKKEPPKTWTPKKTAKTEPSKKQDKASEDVVPAEKMQRTSETVEKRESKVEPLVPCPIKTKHVEKTVTSAAKEKSVGIGLLTEKITKETLPSNEDVDRLLTTKSSPTRRRKCSNMVSSLTKSWKQVEKKSTDGTARDGTGVKDGELLDVEGSKGHSDVKDVTTDRKGVLTEEKQRGGEEEVSAVKIKRSTVTAMYFTFLLTLLATFAATVIYGEEQLYSFNLPVGSGSGKTYKLEGKGRITGVRTWDNGNQVYGLQLRYGDIWSTRAGDATGQMQELELYEDEAIIQVSGKYGHYIHWLHFGTSKGRFFFAGQPNGQCFNYYPEHYGAELRFISGTFHGGLTGFSAHWGLVFGPYDNGKGL